jgi:hypothetical protein
MRPVERLVDVLNCRAFCEDGTLASSISREQQTIDLKKKKPRRNEENEGQRGMPSVQPCFSFPLFALFVPSW